MRNNIFKKILPVACLTGALVCLSTAVSTVAATTTVNVGQGGLVFVPANPTVNVGDTINFVWAGANHSSTSQPSSAFTWGSGVHSSPFTFPVTYTSAGSFAFECTVHVSFGMVGTVTVVAPNQPPTVTITNPVSGTVLSTPANVTVRASASDPDGTVTNVQFLITSGSGTVTFSNRTTAPFSATTNGLPAGSYTLSAIAFDNLSATATNSVTISVVTPVTNILAQAQFQLHTNFSFTYSANVGLKYVVLRSTDLTSAGSWVPIATNQATANPATFTDTNATANPAFYRVGLMPNP